MSGPFKLKYKKSAFPFKGEKKKDKKDKEEIGDTIIYPPGDGELELKGYSKEILDAKNKGRYSNYKNTKEYKEWLNQQENVDRSV